VRRISTELASLEKSQLPLRAAMPGWASEESAGRLGGHWLGGEVSFEFILLISFFGDGGKMLLALTQSSTP
jgi:hypothetical protein